MRVDPRRELAALKDFQRATARYAFRRMYRDRRPAHRFLVADEVGLGKTLVARAVVAQVISHLHDLGEQRIDVVYVCSNATIAEQNLRKLTPADVPPPKRAGRLSLLPGIPSPRSDGVRLIALTPGTSLDHGYAPGKVQERALALQYLRRVWGADEIENVGVYRAFAGNIDAAEGRLSDLRERFARELGDLRPQHGTLGPFHEALREVNQQHQARSDGWSLKDTLRWVAGQYRRQPDNRDRQASQRRNTLIGQVRRAMAATGAAMLRPDLVIFDEFQRFANLLHADDSDAHVLLQRLINNPASGNATATRTLLLSATPYRMHTTDLERAHGQDGHYQDLMRTIKFLAGAEQANAVAGDLRALREALTRVPVDGAAPATKAAAAVSRRLRSFMARTERLTATGGDGMIKTVTSGVPSPSAGDIRQYAAAAEITAAAAHTAANGTTGHDLVELWKSAPYLLSFLNKENYAAARALAHALQGAGGADIAARLPTNPAALPWTDVDRYASIDPGNTRLRTLLEHTADPDLQQLLWLPASAPYYRARSPFETRTARRFTKRLVFSAWRAVPVAISTMLSYESERHSVAVRRHVPYSADAHRRATQPLRFSLHDGNPDTMNSYLLMHPSVALADLVDPLLIAQHLRQDGTEVTLEAVLGRARDQLRPALQLVTAGHGGREDDKWYWLAPILLDRHHRTNATVTYLDAAATAAAATGADGTAFHAHLQQAINVFHAGTDDFDIGAPPGDLLEVLAELAIASPATCALRALRRVMPAASPTDRLHAAARIAFGFRSLFNGAEATAIIQNRDDRTFWRACLRYALDGNLQAVLDEYLHVLLEWQQFNPAEDATALGDHVATVLTTRTVHYRIDAADHDNTWSTHRMRGHYAIHYGTSHGEDNTVVRADRISDAFNSPFWPFVLATTSIGQEGLDFHLYCHAVVHWNLPHNPVDLEQREGRVHRYKGHAIRKNVAARYGPTTAEGDPWEALFHKAAADRQPGATEIAPYWVFDGPHHIERHLLVPPYTRDAAILPHLLGSAALYRLAFGQPRQTEFLRTLLTTLDDTQRAEISEITVDLRPAAGR